MTTKDHSLATADLGIAIRIGLAAAGAVIASGFTAASSSAAPETIDVQQIPAIGTAVSGLVVPSPWSAPVTVTATGPPGEVSFAVPVSPEICATTIGGALVRIDFTNIGRPITGSTIVNPCGRAVDPAPMNAVAHTGSGQIHFRTSIVGSPAYPNAGQPAIPGSGTFNAP